jgi:hypothetical protein
MPGERPPAFEPVQATPASSASADAERRASAAAESTPGDGKKKTSSQKPRKERKVRAGLLVSILLVLVLAGGGVAAALNWAWVTQYFQQPGWNPPYQTYANTTLGVSLQYTQGWNQVPGQGQVQFNDSTHTSQVLLVVGDASGQASDFLNQQASKLGITGLTTQSPTTFADVSWTVAQGTLTQAGATYTVMLYVGQHNNSFYLLAFRAPQSVFASVNQSNFAHVRSTLSFS